MSETLVEHNCGNDKCIMCGPGPDTRERLGHEAGGSSERRARSAGPGVRPGDGIFIGADDTAAHAADRPGAAAVCKQRGELDELCSARNACVVCSRD